MEHHKEILMSKPEVIKIDDVEYVRSDKVTSDEKIKIVVLDRGFVYVGEVTFDDEFVIIQRASNIRIWGTTKGLGQLVSGPTSSTQLDKVGTVKAPFRALISIIDTEAGKWKLL